MPACVAEFLAAVLAEVWGEFMAEFLAGLWTEILEDSRLTSQQICSQSSWLKFEKLAR